MILSSVNFVNTNHQFTDFILGKISEEQRRVSPVIKEKELPSRGLQQKTSFDSGITAYDAQSEAVLVEEQTPSIRADLVAIETSDGQYFLAVNMVNKEACTVSLKTGDRFENSSPSGTFRRRILGTKESKSGFPSCVVAFQLEEDHTLYLTTTNDRQLHMQMCDSELDEAHPDERFFIIHHLKNEEDVFLQPYAHKGYYLHHLDSDLSLRSLDVNWRPPEEYYFRLAPLKELEDVPTGCSEQTHDYEKTMNSKTLYKTEEDGTFKDTITPSVQNKKSYSQRKGAGLFSACFKWIGTGSERKSSIKRRGVKKTQQAGKR